MNNPEYLNSNKTVTGSDGSRPIYNPSARFQWHSISDIWQGDKGYNKVVPNLNDYVIDPPTFKVWIVDHLDPVTLIPSLRRIYHDQSGVIDNVNKVVSPGPSSYRVYLDTNTVPARLVCDRRFFFGGSMSSYAKIFKGVNTTKDGEVISKIYDSSGNFISENVPLEEVPNEVFGVDSQDKYRYILKSPVECRVTTELLNNEIVTVVVYSDNHNVVLSQEMAVVNTTFVRGSDNHQRYISSISLKTPFLSGHDKRLIEYPLGLPLNSLNMMGVVHYSDGSSVERHVDGTKFTMHGLGQYVSSIIGQPVPLVLHYKLDDNETAYATNGSATKSVDEAYNLITTNTYNNYAVKLYAYPEYVNANTGYTLRWYMTNIDRNVIFDVTGKVRFEDVTGGFNPKLYGVLQRKEVSINLQDVSKSFKAWRHPQLVDITLYGPPEAGKTDWTVSQEGPLTLPYYGESLVARKTGNRSVNLESGCKTHKEWLEKTYDRCFAIIDKRVSKAPPIPTHVIVVYGAESKEIQVTSFNEDVTFDQNLTLSTNVYLRFIRRTGNGDLILAVGAMVIKNS